MIKIEIEPVGFDAFTATPVSVSHQIAFARHLREMGVDSPRGSAFFQGGCELPESVQSNERAMRELRQGFIAVVLVDPWEFGHWLGWDAHHVILRPVREEPRNEIDNEVESWSRIARRTNFRDCEEI